MIQDHSISCSVLIAIDNKNKKHINREREKEEREKSRERDFNGNGEGEIHAFRLKKWMKVLQRCYGFEDARGRKWMKGAEPPGVLARIGGNGL